MGLLDGLWAAVTCVMGIITLSPTQNDIVNQTPLQLARPEGLKQHGEVAPYPPSTPIFAPPGTSDPDFQCIYPNMPDWEPCSSPLDRKCWLRNRYDGRQYDVFTDYENETPIGIPRYYELTLTDEEWDADGEVFPFAKLFNGQYPGPLIEACWGDTITVKVTNALKYNGTSVHWHGIRQWNTMHMDGVNGISQCPIAPGDSMEYTFTAMQYGTSWYHSHYSVQYADGAAGPLTIHGPTSDDYDEPVPALIMTDWGHNSAFTAVLPGFNLLDADILLNGRGDVRKFPPAQNSTEVKPLYSMTFEEVPSDQPIKRYLLRIINTSFETTFIFSIDNHMLEVITTDFVPIVPYRNTTVLVGIGQRYDVIVEARPQLDPNNPNSSLPTDGNYWIRTTIAECNSDMSPPNNPNYDETGILRYDNSSTADPASQRWEGFSRDCTDEAYTSMHPVLPWTVGPPNNGMQVFSIEFNGRNRVPNYPLSLMGLELDTNTDPSIRVNYTNITLLNLQDESGDWNQSWRIVPAEKNETSDDQWVYLVLVGSGHPIHLHGHDFAILNQSKTWDPSGFACGQNLNCVNPPRRDVVLLDGYAVIAFKTDNPGAWLVHCHIAFHIAMGLGMQILEDQSAAATMWPPGSAVWNEMERVCTNWESWYSNSSNWAPQDCTEINKQFGDAQYCFQDDSGV